MTATILAGPERPGTDSAGLPGRGSTEERILNAALRLIGRRGVKRLAMQEVSEAAGLSRGTLYRYFPSKDLLLAAAAAFDERRFDDGLSAALAEAPEPHERVRALVAFAFDYIGRHPARSLFESEPEFVMSYLLDRLPKFRAVLVEHLGDAFDTVPAVASGSLSREELADVIMRLFASSWIIPESGEDSLARSINCLFLTTR